MAITKIQSESLNLADNYDFTGSVTGAGGITLADQWHITAGIDASVAGKQWVPATGNNEVNLNGEAGASVATTGGLKGSYIKFTAVAANLYFVEGMLNATGSLSTPFDTQ